jgi:hypothetical protein
VGYVCATKRGRNYCPPKEPITSNIHPRKSNSPQSHVESQDSQAYLSLFTSAPISPSLGRATLPPLFARPIPHHTFPRRQIALAQKRRNIHVQRRVRLRICQELVDSGERGRKRVDGTPVLRREEGETDLAGREGDVWVRYPRGEVNCRRCEGII